MYENQLNFDEIEDEYIDTMIRLAFKQEEALETQEMISISKRSFTLDEQDTVERVHRRFLKAISDQEREKKREKQILRFRKNAVRALQAAAVVIVVLSIATPFAIANVASFRSAVMQLLLSFDDNKQELYVDFLPDESASFDVPAEWPGEYFISYVPDGYQISWQGEYELPVIEYTNENGDTIYFMEGNSDASSAFGTEGAQFTYVNIHGRTALLMYEEDDYPLYNFIWAIDDRWFILATDGVERETAIRIAESVKKIIKE